jgi:two-component system chemotaxis response regulator CheB
MSSNVHVLVVDDSAVVRQTIQAILKTQPDITTSAAADPVIAMDKMKKERPDVIILDLEMPRMDGLTFLRKLMAEDPLPVIVCSGHVGDASRAAVHALEAGAVDLIAKPNLGVQSFLTESAVVLVDAVRAASVYRMPLRRQPRLRVQPAGPAAAIQRARLVAIGASTGGTEAIREVLEPLPVTTCGIVIVQHMPAPFTRSFANRLNELCAIEVKEAEDGDEIRPGRALVAPGSRHMTVRSFGGRLTVALHDGEFVSRHRPSVDVLFRSVAETVGSDAIGVLLTGMGGDGAAGLLEMRQARAITFAQDEATCAVFGMPREAIRRGAAEQVLPLSHIAPALLRMA